MATRAKKPTVFLNDILDYCYCPTRLWWKTQGGAEEFDSTPGTKNTGEHLIRQSVRQAISLYVYASKNIKIGTAEKISLVTTISTVWRKWLENWGLTNIASLIIEYHRVKSSLLVQFDKGGKYSRPDGTLYSQPTWTRHWKQLAQSSGLLRLQEEIDGQQHKAGLYSLSPEKIEGIGIPAGLAEAFSRAFEIVEKTKMPALKDILGVYEPVVVDLPSVRVSYVADFVLDRGKKRGRGRPSKEGDDMKRALTYELHLYEEEIPSPLSLSRDLRVLLLGEATPVEIKLEMGFKGFSKEEIVVRHMKSGKTTPMYPRPGAGAMVLDSLARATINGVKAGIFTARMINGWRSCGNCEYRPLCFMDAGVMEMFNPPLIAQLESGKELYQSLFNTVNVTNQPGEILATLIAFNNWLGQNPGVSSDRVDWVLNSLLTDIQDAI